MLMHASCVAFGPSGVLIKGRSGSGKSSLALELMAFGATLISDDQTCLERREDWVVATAPSNLRGLIEARGIGILSVEPQISARITLVIDMDQVETERMPPDRMIDLMGHPIALLHKVETPYFAAGVFQYMKGGKADR